MKKSLFLALGVGGILLMTFAASAQAQAQEPAATQLGNFFTWLTSTPPNYPLGFLLALSGLAGALVIIFGLIGGAIPGTAGKKRIDQDIDRLNRWTDRLEKEMDNPKVESAFFEGLSKAVNKLRDDIRAERRSQFALAAALYAFLGAFFASAIAQDLLQAVIVGAGWTGIIGSFGLKKDFADRKSDKDSMLEEVLKTIKKADKAGQPPADYLPEEFPDFEEFEARLRAVQSL